MSQQGYLTFYRTEPVADYPAMARALVAISGASKSLWVCRAPIDPPNWKQFVKHDELVREKIQIPKSLPDIINEYKEDMCLNFDLWESACGNMIYDATMKRISKNIRDCFAPWRMIVRIGPHHIFQCVEDEPEPIAYATLSVSFFADGSPLNWGEFRKQLMQLPEVQYVQEKLESVLGKLSVCLYWNL